MYWIKKGKKKQNISIAEMVLVMMLWLGTVGSVQADEQIRTVRIGYYEAARFQEGASEGALKKDYSYEYLQKIASYTGWQYEYVYGSWEKLYEKRKAG